MTPEPWWLPIALLLAIVGYCTVGVVIALCLGMDEDSLVTKLFVVAWPVALLVTLWAVLVHAVICRPLGWAWRRARGKE